MPKIESVPSTQFFKIQLSTHQDNRICHIQIGKITPKQVTDKLLHLHERVYTISEPKTIIQQPKGTEIIHIKPYKIIHNLSRVLTCRKCSKYNLTGTERVLQPFPPIPYGSATFCDPIKNEKKIKMHAIYKGFSQESLNEKVHQQVLNLINLMVLSITGQTNRQNPRQSQL